MTVHEELLVSDFQQCFEQMRHYDETFRVTLSFGFGVVLAVEAASGTLIQHYGLTRLVTLTVGLLSVTSAIAVTLLVGLLARNRVYYAFVARFVNEVRALYLAEKPGGILNKAGMYTDHRFPRIFNPASTQTIQIYFLLICSSLLLATGSTALLAARDMALGRHPEVRWCAGGATLMAASALQLGSLLFYWAKKDRRKKADTAVFGDRG